jgi:hypothetical protein
MPSYMINYALAGVTTEAHACEGLAAGSAVLCTRGDYSGVHAREGLAAGSAVVIL